jgi:putative transposase
MLEHKKHWSIVAMSRALKVSSSGYYSWMNTGFIKCKTPLLDVLVKAEFIAAKKRYGYRRITKAMELKGYHYDKKTIQCSMQRQQLVAIGKKKFRIITNSNHQLKLYPNILKRDFYAEEPILNGSSILHISGQKMDGPI